MTTRLIKVGYVVDGIVALLSLAECHNIWRIYPYLQRQQGGAIPLYVLLFIHACAAPFISRHLRSLDLPRVAIGWLFSPLPILIALLSLIDLSFRFSDPSFGPLADRRPAQFGWWTKSNVSTGTQP